jgi:hypothetical protein
VNRAREDINDLLKQHDVRNAKLVIEAMMRIFDLHPSDYPEEIQQCFVNFLSSLDIEKDWYDKS